jgi:methyl-accepting chemotaxis protein
MEDKDKKGLEDMKTAAEEALRPIQTLAEAVGLMVAGADELNKNFSLGRARIEEMKKAFADSAAGVEKLGGSLDNVVDTITSVAAASNRNVIENEKVISELYAASKVLGISSETLVNNFKDVGYETSQIGTNLSESIEYVQ